VKTLEFFYDPISPYAMLGFHALPQALAGVSAQVRYTPVLFGAMLRANETKGPAEIATKRDWTFRHVHWLAERAGITLVDPAQHPFAPVALLRLALAAADADAPAHTNRWVTEQLFAHVWQSQGKDVNDPQHMGTLQARLAQHVSERGDTWRDPGSEAVKTQLRANTDRALREGVFGVPTVRVDGQVFWGVDALPMLSEYLQA
jgi:2-hydroxychromene-2-carboxylate isomerase